MNPPTQLLKPLGLPLVMGALLAIAIPAPAADTLTSLFGDPVIATGKNVEVKRSQLDEAFISYRANLAARGDDIQDDQRTRKEIGLLERIILTQVLTSRATESDRTNAAAMATRFLADARKSAGESDEAFERHLRALGLTGKKFTERVKEQSLVETILDRELKTSISVTDADVKKFYSENTTRFQQPEIAKGNHIIGYTKDPRTGTDLTAEQVRVKRERLQRAQTRAKAGEDFLTLLKEYSDDPNAAERKGEFVIPRLGKLPEIESAVFTLPINAVSDIIVTPNALHVLKVTERTPARQTEFEKVQEDIRKHLAHREMEKRLPEFFAKLKSEANLQIKDPKYKAVLETTSSEAFENTLGK
jgi:parvulin-like peptidyl-prolyl isomerase